MNCWACSTRATASITSSRMFANCAERSRNGKRSFGLLVREAIFMSQGPGDAQAL